MPLAHGAPEEALASVAGGGAVVLPRGAVAADGAVLDGAAVAGVAAGIVRILGFTLGAVNCNQS